MADLEAPLIGVVDEPVSVSRFRLRSDEYWAGSGRFNGIAYYDLHPDLLLTDEESYLVRGWACGLFGVYNALGLQRGTEAGCMMDVVNQYLACGGEIKDAAGEGIIPEIYAGFGIASAVVGLVNSAADLMPYLKQGYLFQASVWEQNLDELPDSAQTGGGHWNLIGGADELGRGLLLDSDMRTDGKSFGVWTATDRGYRRIAQDYTGEKMSQSETLIYPGEEWWYMGGVLVGPKGVNQRKLEATIAKHGGLVPSGFA
ncbi:MAG: hypothetical protein Q7S31_00765 [bacterium]|nr:hypothetical protein [bacterium]